MWGESIKIGARPFWGRVVFVFGDFKYQHRLPEIAYPAFNLMLLQLVTFFIVLNTKEDTLKGSSEAIFHKLI